MGKKNSPCFVRAVFDLDCEWEGLPPVYRIYFNEELFTEREWRWQNVYLQENLRIMAPPGRYVVRIQPVGPNLAIFRPSNHRVMAGNAEWIRPDILEIRR
jgi:hypothetical protein